MLALLKHDKIKSVDPIQVYLPIGFGFDVPTGTWVKGFHNESVLLGGLGALTGVVGRPNKFKTTLGEAMVFSAMARLFTTSETTLSEYDTESNKQPSRLKHLAGMISEIFKDRPVFEEGIFSLTNKGLMPGDVWFEELKGFIEQKIEHHKEIQVKTVFPGWGGKEPVSIPMPTFGIVDSISNFSTTDVDNISKNNALGDSGANMIHARQGLAKQRLMMEAPTLAVRGSHYMLFTAHVGEKLDLNASPYAPVPQKKLQYLPQGDKIKGVTDAFLYLLHNCWHVVSSNLMVTKDKEAEYPRDSDDRFEGDTDLNEVIVQQLRGKGGQSGIRIPVVISQTDGVLPSLSEFNYIKKSERFGLGGNMQNYYVELLPDVKLSRTTVRGKLERDPLLQRAVNICSEICQIQHYQRSFNRFFKEPKQVYEILKQKGYDWDLLLRTRGWWTVDDEKNPVPRLSTMDILRMCLDKDDPEHYHPYWYPKKYEELQPTA